VNPNGAPFDRQVGGFTGFRFRNRPGPLAANAAKAAGGHKSRKPPMVLCIGSVDGRWEAKQEKAPAGGQG
jgi:hypothetical protein